MLVGNNLKFPRLTSVLRYMTEHCYARGNESVPSAKSVFGNPNEIEYDAELTGNVFFDTSTRISFGIAEKQ
jgi:hypothetical protein